MMSYRIGILSDTHGLLRPEVEDALRGCDAILHGGDIDRQEILDRLARIAPVYAVRGNNDQEWAEQIPEALTVTLGGVTFFVIHNRKKIAQDVSGADVVVYGHSHRYEERCVDPGETGSLGGSMEPSGSRSRSGSVEPGGSRGLGGSMEPGGSGIRSGSVNPGGSGSRADGTGAQLWLNPGSCGPRRLVLPVTMALMEVREDGSCRVERLDILRQKGAVRRSVTARRAAAEAGGIRSPEPKNREGAEAGGLWSLEQDNGEDAARESRRGGGAVNGRNPYPEGARRDFDYAAVQEKDGPKIPANIRDIVLMAIKDMNRGRTVDEIARRAGISYELAEQICRIYVTHPGVDMDGILRRLGL